MTKYRIKFLKKEHSADNIYQQQIVSALIVFMCCAIDFFNVYSTYRGLVRDNLFMNIGMAFSFAVSLDIPLSLAAIFVRKYEEGVCSKATRNIIFILSLAIFFISFVLSFQLKYAARDILFDKIEDKELRSVAAVITACCPLLTSIAAFIISYCSYSFIDNNIQKFKALKIKAEAQLSTLQSDLLSSEDATLHFNQMIAREKDLATEFAQSVIDNGERLKQEILLLFMKHFTSPEDISIITEKANAISLSPSFTTDFTQNMSPEFSKEISMGTGSTVNTQNLFHKSSS